MTPDPATAEAPDLRRPLIRAWLQALGAEVPPREFDHLEAMSRGLRCSAAAAELGVSAETARAYRKRLYRRLGFEGAPA